MMLQPSALIRPERADAEWKNVLRTIATRIGNRTESGEHFTYSLEDSPWHVTLGPVQMDLGEQQQAMVGHVVKVIFRTPTNRLLGPSPYGTSRFDFASYNVDFVARLDEAGELSWSALRNPAVAGLSNDELACWLMDWLVNCRAAYRRHYSSSRSFEVS
jgi:hypothetical protein